MQSDRLSVGASAMLQNKSPRFELNSGALKFNPFFSSIKPFHRLAPTSVNVGRCAPLWQLCLDVSWRWFMFSRFATGEERGRGSETLRFDEAKVLHHLSPRVSNTPHQNTFMSYHCVVKHWETCWEGEGVKNSKKNKNKINELDRI